jgi:hypothetical protein
LGQDIGNYVLTWYSTEDNTPPNSNLSSQGKELEPYVSVALPSRYLKNGTVRYGDILSIDFMKGRTMPNGQKHNGLVRVDDFCGDHGDDNYCFQSYRGQKYPNIDMFIGVFNKSGFDSSCNGPAGSGQELTRVNRTSGGSVGVWGGQSRPNGTCGDVASAKAGKPGKCWYYTPSFESWWPQTCAKVRRA